VEVGQKVKHMGMVCKVYNKSDTLPGDQIMIKLPSGIMKWVQESWCKPIINVKGE